MNTLVLATFAVIVSVIAFITVLIPIKKIKYSKDYRYCIFWIVPILIELLVINSLINKSLTPYTFLGFIGISMMAHSYYMKKKNHKQ
jgi:uncharacterized protein with PQ loop repeat